MPVQPRQHMSRGLFTQEYCLEVEKVFEQNGRGADWAPGVSAGPRFWAEEDKCLELVQDDPNRSNVPSSVIAASPDNALLAVATNVIIRIYDMVTKQRCTELVGHPTNVWKLHFTPTTPDQASEIQAGRSGYLLLSEGSSVGGADGEIIMWDLDSTGRCLNDRTMPFAVDALTNKAMQAISEYIEIHHELGDGDINTIRTGFSDVLKKADARNRVQNLPHMEGHFPSFGSTVASHDGQHVIYIDHGRTTQHGMRSPEDLPQIVVFGLAKRGVRCRLSGHTDAIMWASWSPDDKTIVTASWDQTYKLWDSVTGECRHTIGPTGGQNWSGHFSPDGKHVLLSGGGPTKVAIYDVQSGEEITHLDYAGRRSWMRTVSWNPKTNAVALTFEHTQSVILWHPYENTQEEILKLKSDGSMLDNYCQFTSIKWVDDGRKLIVQTNEGSLLVWEPERHIQWRFQRPVGLELTTWGVSDVLFSSETQTLMSLDGHGHVREWKL